MKKIVSLLAVTATMAVSAHAAVVLTEPFSYADGSIVTNSAGVYTTTSGTAGQVDVTSGVLNITGTETEDVARPIVDSTTIYTSGILAATMDVNFSALPTGAGTYFTHFKDATTSGFRGRVFAITTGAATGSFRLAIANTTTTVAVVPIDLSLNTTYTFTLSLDVATGISSLSVNGSAFVVATDASSALPISTYGFRQATGEGTMKIDNLSIDYTPAAVPEPSTLAGLALGSAFLLARRRRALKA